MVGQHHAQDEGLSPAALQSLQFSSSLWQLTSKEDSPPKAAYSFTTFFLQLPKRF